MHEILIVQYKRSGDGQIDEIQVTDQGGFMPDEDAVDALLDWCKKNKKQFPPQFRKMHNDNRWAEMSQPAPHREKPVRLDRYCQIYVIVDRHRKVYKIGKAGNAQNRYRQMLTANPWLDLLLEFDGKESDEVALHERFSEKRLEREWFSLDTTDLKSIIEHFNNPRIKP